MEDRLIDIAFDVRSDARGRDPDAHSATLRWYHRILWDKPLPYGKGRFSLEYGTGASYLVHQSGLGRFRLSSDSIVHTYFTWRRMRDIVREIPPAEMAAFRDLAHTVGGYVVFPANGGPGLRTINQDRGVNKLINDRVDLTLECVRLAYAGMESPLGPTIRRYGDFFSLFGDFRGYCEFFLLQDLVSDDFSQVRFFLPFVGFTTEPLPKDVAEYRTYMAANIAFLKSRNARIQVYARSAA